MVKPLLTITEDEDGLHDIELFFQPAYGVADYAQLAADAIKTIADAFGVPVEMVRGMVNLRVKHSLHDLKETNTKRAHIPTHKTLQ